jgi:hypothetical protein
MSENQPTNTEINKIFYKHTSRLNIELGDPDARPEYKPITVLEGIIIIFIILAVLILSIIDFLKKLLNIRIRLFY